MWGDVVMFVSRWLAPYWLPNPVVHTYSRIRILETRLEGQTGSTGMLEKVCEMSHCSL